MGCTFGEAVQFLVFNFPSIGPFGTKAESAYADLATNIAEQEV